MVDLAAIERLVDEYIRCWAAQGLPPNSILEDNDFGCEDRQVLSSGDSIEDFTHADLCRLVVLLTRSLRGQINRDHKLLWTWTCYLLVPSARALGSPTPTWTLDIDWRAGFTGLVHTAVAPHQRERVNFHVREGVSHKHLVAGPLAFALLEGLLRRKCPGYLAKDGTALQSFSVKDASGVVTKTNQNQRVNRVNKAFRIFEQLVVVSRGRGAPSLAQFCAEVDAMHRPAPGADVFDLVDSWRNDLVHGNQYWQHRTPVLLNLICLLVIDEFDPEQFDQQLPDLRRRLAWQAGSPRAPWDLYPPDLDRA